MTSKKDQQRITNLKTSIRDLQHELSTQRKAATDSGQQASREADLRVQSNREVEGLRKHTELLETANRQFAKNESNAQSVIQDMVTRNNRDQETIALLTRLLDKAVASNQALLDAVNAKPKMSVAPTTFDDLLNKIKF